MKKIMSFLVSLSLCLTITMEASTLRSTTLYSDLVAGAWYYDFVLDMANRGVVKGYTDGSFKPDSLVTLGEFYTMLCSNGGYEGVDSSLDHWSGIFAENVRALAWLDKIPADLNQTATRYQVAEAVFASTGAVADGTLPNHFADANSAMLNTLFDMDILEGSWKDDGKRYITPDSPITRAELCAIFSSLQNYMENMAGVTDFRYLRPQAMEPLTPSFTQDYFEDLFTYMLAHSITEYTVTFENFNKDKLNALGGLDYVTDCYYKRKSEMAEYGSFFSALSVRYSFSGTKSTWTFTTESPHFDQATTLQNLDLFLLDVGYRAQAMYESGKLRTTMSDYDKAYYLYGYCAENFAYDTQYKDISFTGYGLTAYEVGVCQAYVAMYHSLCSIWGVETYGVSGTVNGNHIWICGNLDGTWYYIDPTFGDPIPDGTKANYEYFAMTRSEISKTHSFDPIWQ